MSNDSNLETGPQPNVRIGEVHGNLLVRGWGDPRIWARAPGDQLHVQRSDEQVTVHCTSDLQIYLPLDSTLTVGDAHGDTQVVEVRGESTIANCQGNLVLSQVGATTVENASGDLSAKNIGGDLAVINVAGNASILQVQGNLRLVNCAGDLSAKSIFGQVESDNVAGNCSLNEVQGNARLVHCAGDLRVRGLAGNLAAEAAGNAMLKLAFPSGGRCAVTAGGDIACKVPPQLDAHVRLVSHGDDIRIRRLPVAENRRQGETEFTLGSGDGELTLEAGGSILLSGKLEDSAEWQFGPFNVEIDPELQQEMVERTSVWIQQVTEQVERQMEGIAAQLDARLSQLGTSDEIAARVQQKVQQAMRRAEEKIAAAVRQAEERAQRADRDAARHERRARVYTYQYQTPPVPPIPPMPPVPPRAAKPQSAPVSDEERMLILRMVEQGKISVEQAEKLLAALES
jgi:DUF4097 and DUF4098 domain-containing protein YvlB